MSDDALCWLNISDIRQGLLKRRFSIAELVKAFIERIEKNDPKLESYVTTLGKSAISRAKELDENLYAGNDLGPLHGIPFSLKDVFMTRGILTTGGSAILADWVPDQNATVVQKLYAAGGILLGKTNSHEFAYGVTTQNIHCSTRNPWDKSRIPGGSSGGSGAAVAAGLCTFSIGTDTAGSIRLPAALNGIVGLKPTFGRISCAGVIAQSFSADHAGPMARSVADIALVMQFISGFDTNDSETSREPVPDFYADLENGDKGLRIGVPIEFSEMEIQPYVAKAFVEAQSIFKNLGYSVRQISIPSLRNAADVNSKIIMAETTARHRLWAQTWFTRYKIQYGEDVQELLDRGRKIGIDEFILASVERKKLRAQIDDVFINDVDLILTPSVPFTAPKIDQKKVLLKDNTVDILNGSIQFLSTFSLTGFPALAIPAGFDNNSLPLSIQIVGRAFDEMTVLQVGHNFEMATRQTFKRP